MRKYSINAMLVRTTENLYDKTLSAVQINGSTREWFRPAVGVRQGCLLSPTLYFLDRIMSHAVKEYNGKGSIGGRTITSLLFADQIVVLLIKSRNWKP